MTDEFWDLRDRDDNLTGLTHKRGEPVPEGQFHIVASVCAVRDDGRMLLTQRAAEKSYALGWEIPAGSVLAGESSAQGAVRELGEETGVFVTPERLQFIGRIVETSAFFDLYAVRVSGNPTVTPDPNEVNDYAWATLADLDARIAEQSMARPWLTRLQTYREPLVAFLASTTRS